MLVLGLVPPLAPRPLVVAYVANWVDDLPAFAETIDYDKLTHLDLAFENPVADDGTMSYNVANDAVIAKAHAHGVKVLISIGGGGAPSDPALVSRTFSLIAADRRAGFVRKLRDFVRVHRLDGLDVDLEGPMINGDYGAFVAELGAALHADGKRITAALSQGYGGEQVPGAALETFDFVNLMAYDATGPWRPQEPGQHSSLDYAKTNVRYWLGRGLPKTKMVLGVPFYGYGFGADAKGDEWSYAKILATYPGAEGRDRSGNTVWYNGVATIRAKAAYVRAEGLAGAMIWSLNSDAARPDSLLDVLANALAAPPKRERPLGSL